MGIRRTERGKQAGYNVNGKDILTGYSGMIWADPEKLDVVRLDVQPADLPPDIKTLTQTIRYARGSIQGVSTNLPASSEFVLQDTRGIETRLTCYHHELSPIHHEKRKAVYRWQSNRFCPARSLHDRGGISSAQDDVGAFPGGGSGRARS
jgi:hypothetical protein